MPGGWLAPALVAIAASTAAAVILVDRMPPFDGRAIFFMEVALAVALGLVVFWHSRRSDRAIKSALGDIGSMLRRNDKAKQIRRTAASRTLHSTVSSMLDACATLARMGHQPGKATKPEWEQLKANLAALHGEVRASADRLGRELEHAGYLDDRVYDGIVAAVGLLGEKICVDDKGMTVDAASYFAMMDALRPVLPRLERLFALGADSLLAIPGPVNSPSLSDRLEIRLDRDTYYPNAVIRASVSADEPLPSRKVTVAILDEDLAVLAKKTVKIPKADRPAAGPLAIDIRLRGLVADRQYIARATCGGLVSEELFTVDRRAPVVQTDKPDYMMDEDMLVTVMDPAADTDSAVEESVGDTKRSRLVIMSPHGKIDGYRLVETGKSTGVFRGWVRCMGVRRDGSVRGTTLDDGAYVDRTQGTGAEDGVIACSPGNLIRIKYTNEFGTGEAAVYASESPAVVDLDRDEYPCTGTVRIHVILPDPGLGGGEQPATVGDDRRDCWATVSTGEGSLDGYRLVEAGPGSGMFAGTVSLTGLAGTGGRKRATDGAARGVTRGAGPHDGMLACRPDDTVRVSVESAFAREALAEAPVRWHIGDVRMSKATYLPGEEVEVRVADVDMSVDRGGPGEFQVRAWSDSDRAGIPVAVRETDRNSGVFKGRFATGAGRSRPDRSILEAADGDTVYAEYDDETLPSPHACGDSVAITSSALVTAKKKIAAPLARLVVDGVRIRGEKTDGGAPVAGDKAQVLIRVRNPGQAISFTAIMQVADSDGATAEILYQPLSARADAYATHAFPWIPARPGTHVISIVLWRGMDDPVAYAPAFFRPVQVIDPHAAGAGQGGGQGGEGPAAAGGPAGGAAGAPGPRRAKGLPGGRRK